MKSRPEWYYNQSAVIPYKINNGELYVLLITSRKKKKWIIPKGIIEIGMKPGDSAIKEAMEEAGVVGIVDDEAIGEYGYDKWGGNCKVKVFPMKVKKELNKWPEDNFRIRKWFLLTEAAQKVDREDLAEIITNLKTYLKSLVK